MSLNIDHVLFAWPDHDEILSACEAVGLVPRFGGVHDGGETQNSLIAFPDGSYLELIAPTEPGTNPDRWAGIVDHWRGPENWCIQTDVRSILTRALKMGMPVTGPNPGSRERPDGTNAEWTIGRYGPHQARGVLPFAIADRTPREFRVPGATVMDGPLTGVTEVLIGVESVHDSTKWLQQIHDFPTPIDVTTPLAADILTFPGQPVSLLKPETETMSALAHQLDETEQQPLAFLLSTKDFEAAIEQFALTDIGEWKYRHRRRRVAWFDVDLLRTRVGVIEDD